MKHSCILERHNEIMLNNCSALDSDSHSQNLPLNGLKKGHVQNTN